MVLPSAIPTSTAREVLAALTVHRDVEPLTAR
jgi:hypothetical protein